MQNQKAETHVPVNGINPFKQYRRRVNWIPPRVNWIPPVDDVITLF